MKRIIFFVPFLIASFNIFCQDIDKAINYFSNGDYNNAATEFENLLKTFSENEKNDTTVYTKYLLYTAVSFEYINNYEKAIEYYKEGITIFENYENYYENEWYFDFLSKIGFLYKNLYKFEEAITYFIKYKENTEKKYGKESLKYSDAAKQLGIIYREINDYEKSNALLSESKQIIEKNFGKDNLDYVLSCNELAILKYYSADYLEAEKLFLESLNITEKIKGKNNADYSNCCNNLAGIYSTIGLYKKAEIYYKESMSIIEKIYGKNHYYYAVSCNNIALFYKTTGNYADAEKYYLLSKAVFEKIKGTESPEYAKICNNLGKLYSLMGNFANAEKLLNEGKKINEKIYGTKHSEYALSCNNLGSFYESVFLFEKAEPLLIEAKNVREKIYGKENPEYAYSCSDLGMLYYQMKDYSKAESLFTEALLINELSLGKQNKNRAGLLQNLAELYFKTENFVKAEKLLLEANEIDKKLLGKFHPDYAISSNSLAIYYNRTGNKEKAIKYYLEINQNIDQQVINSGTFMSSSEREMFINSIINYYHNLHSFYFMIIKDNAEFASNCYNNSLLLKGLLLRSNLAMKNAILQSNDEKLIKKYNDWVENTQLLSKLRLIPIEERFLDIDSLYQITNTQEKELFSSAVLKNYLTFDKMNWQNVQKKLEADEIAIEFIDFKYFNKNAELTDSILYCALLISKEMQFPKMIYLCEEKDLKKILTKPNAEIDDYTFVKSLYDKSSEQSKKLYELTWKPIENETKNFKTIYLSPSGLLNRISYKALINTNGNMLSDLHEIIYLSSTSNLLLTCNMYLKDIENMVLFGGINYNPDTNLWKNSVAEYHTENTYLPERNYELENAINENRGGYSQTFSYLDGTKQEVIKIDSVIQKQKINTQIFEGLNATEEAFKNYKYKSPTIVHIATHGFYFPEVGSPGNELLRGMEELKFQHSRNPMERSGLAFAGSNWTWEGTNKVTGVDDGILTAEEISRVLMDNAKLVVLSACQTGLGDVRGSEGVYGLQRALKMAGVDYMIISLWEVPDEQTQKMMVKFYENLQNGLEINQAFDKAQNDLKEEYRHVKGGAYAWAAFVLIY